MEKQINHLEEYIQSRRRKGGYMLFKEDAIKSMKVSENAFYCSISRLAKKRAIAHIKKGLYAIVPPEYFYRGTIPPKWFIDDLMKHLKQPYYIGLLSAAALHGSAHQAPQVLQVITDKKIRPLRNKFFHITFHCSKNMSLIPVQDIKTPTGYIKVSTPEGTAFDLLRYMHQSGNLNHVALVLSELAETIQGNEIVKVGKRQPIIYCQRLGYLLDTLGHSSLTQTLYTLLQSQKLNFIFLRPDSSSKEFEKNLKWRILVNEKIDLDI